MHKNKNKYLKGGQVKLDKNKDGKLSGIDFKMMGDKANKGMKYKHGGKGKAMGGMKMNYGHGGRLPQHD